MEKYLHSHSQESQIQTVQQFSILIYTATGNQKSRFSDTCIQTKKLERSRPKNNPAAERRKATNGGEDEPTSQPDSSLLEQPSSQSV